MERILEGIRMIRKNADFLVVVTNDVSGDQGPYSEETEAYRKLLGRINCALAGEADEVYEVICGEPVMVKKKKREDTEVEERRTDRSVDRQRGIRLFVGGAYQGKSNASSNGDCSPSATRMKRFSSVTASRIARFDFP